MTDEQNSKCHVIIHTATAAASAIAAGLAQIPGSDAIPITGIQITMIISLGGVFGRNIAKSAAESILAGAVAAVGGRTVSQFLVGWIPLWGNTINAVTAATITEGIGWYVAKNFSEEEEKQAEAARKAARKAEERAEAAARKALEEAETAKKAQAKKAAELAEAAARKALEEAETARVAQAKETEERAKAAMSIGQMFLCVMFSVVLATLCMFSEVILRFASQPKLWSAGAGIILAVVFNIVIFMMCGRKGRKSQAKTMMSYTNYIALVMNIGYSLVRLPVDLPDLFKDVHGWEEAVLAILRMPFVNWGLAIVAVLWWLFRKH